MEHVAVASEMSKSIDKTKKSLKDWRNKQNRKVDPILRDNNRYFHNLLSNSAYRIAISVLLFFGVVYFCFAFGLSVEQLRQSRNSVAIPLILGIFVVMLYFPIKYMWSNYNQLSYETELNKSISSLKWRIRNLSKPSGKKNYRSLQAGITELRRNLMGYLDNSAIVSLPVADFELNRLKKRIDIFSNCASEALVPIDKLFSLAEERDKEFYGEPPEDEDFEHYEFGKTYETQQERAMTGEFTEFDLDAMDDFVDHLWDVLFDKEVKRYWILSYKHPVNLILLSRFFATWNRKISKCSNCKEIFEKASKDIEAYYESVNELKGESRQRRWKLRDDAIIVIVSVGLSTLIQYLISLLE